MFEFIDHGWALVSIPNIDGSHLILTTQGIIHEALASSGNLLEIQNLGLHPQVNQNHFTNLTK